MKIRNTPISAANGNESHIEWKDEKETKHLEAFERVEERLKLFQVSIVERFKLFQVELLDPMVMGTLNALEASHRANVKRVVLTPAIVPNPKSPPNTLFHPCCVNYLTLASTCIF
eukprot:Gb_24765 [translate_table: standard]